MTTKHAIIASSKFNPLNYSEVVRNSFTDVMHRAVPYKCLHAFEQYITGFQFDYVFDTQADLDAFIVSVPESITKLQCVSQLLKMGRYAELIAVLNLDTTGVSKILFDASHRLDRVSTMVNQFGGALKMTSDELDDFFVSASKILV